jgi:hypothetical protein
MRVWGLISMSKFGVCKEKEQEKKKYIENIEKAKDYKCLT